MAWTRQILALLALRGMLSARLPPPFRSIGDSAIAVVVVGLALVVRLGLSPWLTGAQFITFFPAIIVASLLGGTFAGLLAIALSAIAAAVVFPAPDILNAVVLFALVAMMDVAIISGLLSMIARSRASEARIGELNAHLAASEARFRDLLETAPDAMVIADAAERIVLVNQAAVRMFGYERYEMIGHHIDMLMPPAAHGVHRERFGRFIAEARPKRMGDEQDLFGRHKSGAEIPIETNLSLLAGPEGWLVSSTLRDVSRRKEGEARQTLLIRELNHRVKNTLASVQAIVAQTLKTAATPRAFADAVMARLTALSQSHDVLTRSDWSGAEVRDIVAEQLSPYESGDRDRFHIEGPGVKLHPNRAVTLGMTLGELATNAAKYGALSVDSGSVTVRWSRLDTPEGVRLRLAWIERGGPIVSVPQRRGFGTRMIERGVAGGLQGEVRMIYDPAGFTGEIEFPLLKGET